MKNSYGSLSLPPSSVHSPFDVRELVLHHCPLPTQPTPLCPPRTIPREGPSRPLCLTGGKGAVGQERAGGHYHLNLYQGYNSYLETKLKTILVQIEKLGPNQKFKIGLLIIFQIINALSVDVSKQLK